MIRIPGLAREIDPELFTDVACGLCGSTERSTNFTDGPFNVVTCGRCRLVYVTPRLNDASLIDEVYNEGYWSSSAAKDRGYTDYRADEKLYEKTYTKRMAIVRRHFSGATSDDGRQRRVLDVGCAAGYFLGVMQQSGWDVLGLEPSSTIAETARERLGAKHVQEGLLGNVELEPASFDLITFWDVVEHIPDVVGALQLVRTLLRPGGKLLIETQNVQSRAAKTLGPKWQHYKHAEHIYHFDPKTIADLMAKSGFRILENSPRLGGKYVSLGFVAERAARLHKVAAFLLSPLKLASRASVYVNLFDEMIVVAEPLDAT